MSYSRALIVDDSKIARVTLKKKLEQRGIETVVAEHAQEALELLKTEPVDVIFMDHMMPGMDGFEATRHIKANESTAHLPVIMCSGKENDDYLDQAKAIGASNILPKPTASEALDAVFAQLEHQHTATAAPSVVNSEAPSAEPAVISAPDHPVAANTDQVSEINDRITPLADQVNALGERLNALHSDIGAQLAASSEATASIQAIEQQQAEARASGEAAIAAIRDELGSLIDERLSAVYIPAAREGQSQIRNDLHAELGASLDNKLAEATDKAVRELQSSMPKLPDEQALLARVEQSSRQGVDTIKLELQQSQQQLGAALRVELERHLANELAAELPAMPDVDALRAELKSELASELRDDLGADLLISQPAAPGSNRALTLLTLMSTMVAGISVALHFVL